MLAIALLGFYVAWPAWSGYVIREALRSQDAARLASKVDFERVRASLLPVVTAKVDEGVGRYQSQLGGAGAILLEQFKKDALPKVVDATLRVLVTPQMIIRLASEAGPIREGIDRVVREQLGRRAAGSADGSEPASPQAGGQGLGGLLGKVLKRGDQQPAAGEPPAPNSEDLFAGEHQEPVAQWAAFVPDRRRQGSGRDGTGYYSGNELYRVRLEIDRPDT